MPCHTCGYWADDMMDVFVYGHVRACHLFDQPVCDVCGSHGARKTLGGLKLHLCGACEESYFRMGRKWPCQESDAR